MGSYATSRQASRSLHDALVKLPQKPEQSLPLLAEAASKGIAGRASRLHNQYVTVREVAETGNLEIMELVNRYSRNLIQNMRTAEDILLFLCFEVLLCVGLAAFFHWIFRGPMWVAVISGILPFIAMVAFMINGLRLRSTEG